MDRNVLTILPFYDFKLLCEGIKKEATLCSLPLEHRNCELLKINNLNQL